VALAWRNRELALPLRVAVTALMLLLGAGYLFAVITVFVVTGDADGKSGMTPDDAFIRYAGDASRTRLASVLHPERGSMSIHLDKKDDNGVDRSRVEKWLADGAPEAAYQPGDRGTPGEILDRRCSRCHYSGKEAAHLGFDFKTYANMETVLRADRGVPAPRLLALTHSHLFGMGFIALALSVALCGTRFSDRLKVTLTLAAFSAIAMDIGGWWLAKLSSAFVYLTLAGGAVMGLSFSAIVALVLADLWILKAPAAATPGDTTPA
jgi:hypothetical protein